MRGDSRRAGRYAAPVDARRQSLADEADFKWAWPGSHAHDPQAAMPHARTRRGGRGALRKPAIPPRRLIRRGGTGKLRLWLANATEPHREP